MEILIFKTDINTEDNLNEISSHLNSIKEIHKWTVDLEDREKILRIESNGLTALEIENRVKELNYNCKELDD